LTYRKSSARGQYALLYLAEGELRSRSSGRRRCPPVAIRQEPSAAPAPHAEAILRGDESSRGARSHPDPLRRGAAARRPTVADSAAVPGAASQRVDRCDCGRRSGASSGRGKPRPGRPGLISTRREPAPRL
jgi:hypothetical protein